MVIIMGSCHQGCGAEQRRQLEYVVEQVRRDPPLSPPPSPDPVLDTEVRLIFALLFTSHIIYLLIYLRTLCPHNYQ